MKKYLIFFDNPVRQYPDYAGPFNLDQIDEEWKKLSGDSEVYGAIELTDPRTPVVKAEKVNKKNGSTS